MNTKALLMTCLGLTAIVVCIACRIEYLNVQSGYFLPRHDASDTAWVVPEIGEVLERLDDQFFERRQNLAAVEAAVNGANEPKSVSIGAPYSASEQRSLDSLKDLHASHSSLLWWVGSFGIAQYFLAPLALIVAIICAVALAGWGYKFAASLCACLNGLSIVLMLTRNYWNI
jgi:hypothetical protein